MLLPDGLSPSVMAGSLLLLALLLNSHSSSVCADDVDVDVAGTGANVEDARADDVTYTGANEDENVVRDDCVELTECEPIYWLMKNKYNIPGRTAQDIVKIVRNIECGPMKVKCIEVDSAFFADNADADADMRHGGVMDMLAGGRPRPAGACPGQLQLLYMTRDYALTVTFDMGTAHLRRDLQIEAPPEEACLVRVRSLGPCCWSLHEHVKFRGRSFGVDRGEEMMPDEFEVQSVRRRACPDGPRRGA